MRYVLFHSKCYDGFGAAYSAWKRFGDANTTYIPVSHGAPIPEMPEAHEVYILDFAYSPDVIKDLLSRAVSVTILDHHKTAEKDLEPLKELPEYNTTALMVVFDMDRSGAKITWEWLHGVPAPALIEHISDRDLWQFKLAGSKEIHRALVSYPMDFKLWDSFDVEQLKNEGAALDRLYTQLVSNIVDHAWIGEIDGYQVPIVNTSIAWSEVGNELVRLHPDAKFAASFTVFNDQIMWSLRSQGEFDVSVIAKKYGGGGHKSASGFKTPRY